MVQNKSFRDLRASIPSPVSIVTTTGDEGPAGATVSAFMPLSLDPHLILVALQDGSGILERIRTERRFAVNLLAENQSDLAIRFGSRAPEKFADSEWHLDHGLPRFQGTAGWFVCELADELPGGDHSIVLGDVLHVAHQERSPMVYSHRLFGTHSEFAQRPRRPIADHITALAW